MKYISDMYQKRLITKKKLFKKKRKMIIHLAF